MDTSAFVEEFVELNGLAKRGQLDELKKERWQTLKQALVAAETLGAVRRSSLRVGARFAVHLIQGGIIRSGCTRSIARDGAEVVFEAPSDSEVVDHVGLILEYEGGAIVCRARVLRSDATGRVHVLVFEALLARDKARIEALAAEQAPRPVLERAR
ncbi:MAG: hypothetical protein ACYC8T_20090 [Myxococcaceae bacterium]